MDASTRIVTFCWARSDAQKQSKSASRSGMLCLVPALKIAFICLVFLFRAQSSDDATASIISDLRSGKYAEAKQLIDQALLRSPQDSRLWTLDGFVLVHLGSSKAALEAYQHALQISPDYLPALEGAAELEYKASDQAAVPLLERIIKLHPGDQTSHAMLGALAYQRHDCEAAVKEFSQCDTVTSSQPAALDQYGSCLVKLKRISQAVPVFQRISEIQPQNDQAKYNLAVVESLAGRPHEVIAILTELLKKRPDDADSLYLLADAYEAVSDTPGAVAALRHAIVIAPDVAEYYLDFASISLAHASYQVGIDMLNAGLKRLPTAASLYFARGILYVQLGKFDDAERDFERGEQLNPNLQYGRAAEGLAAVQRNDLPQAERVLRSRLAKAPNDAFLNYLLGDVLLRRGATPGSPAFQEALHCAKRAVELQTHFALGRDLLGRLLLQEGKTDQAIEQSRLAFQQDPTDQTALYHLILALRKGGRNAEIPPLTKKMAELLEQARKKEAAEHKYSLVEVPPQK